MKYLAFQPEKFIDLVFLMVGSIIEVTYTYEELRGEPRKMGIHRVVLAGATEEWLYGTPRLWHVNRSNAELQNDYRNFYEFKFKNIVAITYIGNLSDHNANPMNKFP